MPKIGLPEEVAQLRKSLVLALNQVDSGGRKVGDARFGVYAFFDYDGEPIYVGQTKERLRVRIRRHLTNQRTDAVAMNVLDPFEVAEIEMWPLWDLQNQPRKPTTEAASRLNAAEYTVFRAVLQKSTFNAVLNEKDVLPAEVAGLPISFRSRIVPQEVFHLRNHPDVRIARRASTIANLAKVISEREVSPGLRRTLVTQARRLERLATRRFSDFRDEPIPTEDPEEETE